MLRKAIVMAGGKATRLYPLTRALNKHVLPVGGQPMIHWVIKTLVDGGVQDILVILNNSHAQQVMEVLEDGENYGCNIVYAFQGEPAGLMKHLQAGKSFIGNKDFILMLGDSLYLTKLNFQEVAGPHLWAMPSEGVDEIEKYAQVNIVNDQVLEMLEKSDERHFRHIQTGAWTLPSDAFERAEQLFKLSPKEVQIRTLVHQYIDESLMMATVLPPGSFLDLGTHSALQKGSELIRGLNLVPAK